MRRPAYQECGDFVEDVDCFARGFALRVVCGWHLPIGLGVALGGCLNRRLELIKWKKAVDVIAGDP